MDWIVRQFEYGFEEHDGFEISTDWFHPEIICDKNDTIPIDYSDPAYAGEVKLGSTCYMKCKEGYKFHDVDGDKYFMTCTNNWSWGVEWNVFDNAWDR